MNIEWREAAPNVQQAECQGLQLEKKFVAGKYVYFVSKPGEPVYSTSYFDVYIRQVELKLAG